ncbi:MAG: tripartite tricarboxylate transporter substrate-binding protein [Blastocatellia bacterium]
MRQEHNAGGNYGTASFSGELKLLSTGIGTGTHVGVEKFNQAAGIKTLHVPPLPTDSNANTIANAIEGGTTYCMLPLSLGLPAIRDGKLVALGVTTARRSAFVPDVPKPEFARFVLSESEIGAI